MLNNGKDFFMEYLRNNFPGLYGMITNEDAGYDISCMEMALNVDSCRSNSPLEQYLDEMLGMNKSRIFGYDEIVLAEGTQKIGGLYGLKVFHTAFVQAEKSLCEEIGGYCEATRGIISETAKRGKEASHFLLVAKAGNDVIIIVATLLYQKSQRGGTECQC